MAVMSLPADDPLVRALQQVDPLPDDRGSAPALLYHYTSADGLIGILSSGEVWATHAQSMNDASEVSFAADTVALAVTGERGRLAERPWEAFLEECEHLCHTHDLLLLPFFACFCEDGDLLSQWRAYGEGSGFSIGFEASALPSLTMPNVMRTQLLRVVYDPAHQRDRVMKGLARTREVFEKLGAEPARLHFWVNELLPMLCSFKHPAFAEEREWRLASLQWNIVVPEAIGVEFRSRAGLVIPFARFSGSGGLPIRALGYGPRASPEQVERQVGLLVERYGYGTVPITSSYAPLRS